jgi:hypothetical protein
VCVTYFALTKSTVRENVAAKMASSENVAAPKMA